MMKSKLMVWVLMFIFVFTACGFAGSDDPEESKQDMQVAAADGIRWLNYDEGISRGKSEDKKVFLNFYADWCRYCKMMDQKTFQDKEVIAYLNQNFVPVRVDSDKNRKVSMEYNVQGLPVSWFISADGENIGSQPGYIPPEMMLPLLKYIETDSYKTMNFQKFQEGL
ncbi:MAG: thioredoxin family protein [Thermodesulfobacteriota bacterium]